MTVDLLVITDGRRECIDQTIPSALANLHGLDGDRWIYDDSGDPDRRAWLAERFPDFRLVWHRAGRQGFGGAIRTAWQHLLIASDASYIFHLEDDFTFNRPVDLDDMRRVLDAHPSLTQMALRRQPWNAEERAAGGIVEKDPHDFADCTDGTHEWLEHRRFFTTNPCLYRRSLMEIGWPDVEHSEGMFTHQLIEDPAVRFGYWGARDSGEAVEHIGHVRVGTGY